MGKKNRLFLANAKHLSKEDSVNGEGFVVCVQCNKEPTWRHKEEISGKVLMRTSPFIAVNTPFGTRRIHNYCLYLIQRGANG